MKRAVVKYTRVNWGEGDGWNATLSVDGEEYAKVAGRDYMQVAIAIQGYVMNLADEASPSYPAALKPLASNADLADAPTVDPNWKKK